jgi:hypothetical protein
MGRVRSSPDSDSRGRMLQAVTYLKNHPKEPVRKVARDYGVPESSLRNRWKLGKQPHSVAHKSQLLLTPEHEAVLVRWILQQDEEGHPPRQKLIIDKAKKILEIAGVEDPVVSPRWIGKFLKRHPQLQAKHIRSIDRQRRAASNKDIIKHYFNEFNTAKETKKVKDSNIWNMDEKGFLIGVAKSAKVITRRGRRNPKITMDGNRELVTVLEAVSAGCEVLPPCIVWKGKCHIEGRYSKEREKTGTLYATSPNGWTDNELGLEWMKMHFERLTRPE